jgi:hypothetical protein
MAPAFPLPCGKNDTRLQYLFVQAGALMLFQGRQSNTEGVRNIWYLIARSVNVASNFESLTCCFGNAVKQCQVKM